MARTFLHDGMIYSSKAELRADLILEGKKETQKAIQAAGMQAEYDAARERLAAVVAEQRAALAEYDRTHLPGHRHERVTIIQQYQARLTESSQALAAICDKAKNYKEET